MGRGGYRPNSGPPKGTKYRPRNGKEPKLDEQKVPEKPKPVDEKLDLEADEYLRKVWNDPSIDHALRIRAAEIAVKGRGEKLGKKEEKEGRAKAAVSGKFAASAPPLLKVVSK